MPKLYKALIVDDERLARKDLTGMLADFPEIEIVGEAEDVPSAKEAIKKLNPDIVFLDIQMPGQTGFDLLDEMQIEAKVIFVTAYDEYALRAFEINALDYLMKPVTAERLKNSIQRIKDEKTESEKPLSKLQYSDRLFTSIGTKVQFLKIESILLIRSEGDYSYVETIEGNKGLVTKSMKEWEERLPENHFCRIHRTTIINTDHIENIEKWFNYSFRVKMKNIEEPLIMSRRYAKKLKDLYG
jgi:two-component system LytT family response regulator